MPLNRRDIERRDFPVTLRGYETGTVDAHIRMLADEYEALAAQAEQVPQAAAAVPASMDVSDQVRFIVEAAEKSVGDMKAKAQADTDQLRQQTDAEVAQLRQKTDAEVAALRQQAELETGVMRSEARNELERARADASEQARVHVAGVAQVAHGLLSRVEVMEREIATLLEGFRSNSQRVSAELGLLQAAVGEVRTTTVALTSELPADASASGFIPAMPVADILHSGAAPLTPPPFVAAETDASASVAPPAASKAPPATASVASGIDPGEEMSAEDGARMIALNMALNGTPRADTERHIQENYEVNDLGGLLDDVYARAGV